MVAPPSLTAEARRLCGDAVTVEFEVRGADGAKVPQFRRA